ncbi:50S ribosomal protein L10 [Francisella adeliensis]|uniref:Large ribosomal subunit protein uL10 n=1 Tax=Francisella adeliensis TaxID=2007306 RepID=A0A2Z4XX04_9GAMM|nr:50S ribosomal protein L10 [Francisella adeliensis]AXA33259.1 50S ribosomal protein L10 [Francisella adeliensis]MBK2085018.1 50S ribosomal protein L10 [Francisella adeliensis]MBK2096991.1 50S ribosomal protein L10 [Francisella adeliensis]QIW11485.1 50S ribosomal protein L10 [Francisella adeliensis]QIW13360.1 50S ribosomal protein L10 [Francisella adeliensis]
MALRIEDKKAIVAEVAEQVSSALSAAVADYRGLTVNEMTSLRVEARKSGVYLRVVRNNLARLAIKGTDFECLDDALVGPLVLALSMESPGASAKLFKNFQKDHKSFEVKNLVMEGELYGPEKLDDFAKIPTKDEALAILLNVMQAPVTKLARTLKEVSIQAE